MRIVIIQGLGRLDSGLEQTIAEAFRERYPKASISIEGLWFGLYWQQGRLRRLVNDIVEKYDHDGTETMLIGHSVGGNVVLACERYFINSHILGMATICAPLQSDIFPELLDVDHKLAAPLITFGAMADTVVMHGTGHRQSLKHTWLPCDHFWGLWLDSNHARCIARIAHEEFA